MTDRILGWEEGSTPLHEARLDTVVERLRDAGVASVLELGCGSGALLRRLIAEPGLRRIVGLDPSEEALADARSLLASADGSIDARLTLRVGSALRADPDLAGLDAVVLVETLEHLDPGHLSRLEAAVFTRLRPRLILITTPNREFNVLYGLGDGELRHPHHRFEWDRARFQRWAAGVAARAGYDVVFEGIGPANAWFGSPTQMAVFRRDAGDPSL